jgi:cysteine-rich repeat protein
MNTSKMVLMVVLAASGCTLLTGAFRAKCGDGFLQKGENCDDGDKNSGDGCSSVCQLECGDGVVNDGTETCDDGNAIAGDGCDEFCQIEIPEGCGDNVVSGLEECDDGNNANDDGCSAVCVVECCGDGVVNSGTETCDDTNAVPGDGCNAVCIIEVCGDSVVNNVNETCDDGGAASGDGCSATCQLENAILSIAFVGDPLLSDADFIRAYVGGTADNDFHGVVLTAVGPKGVQPALPFKTILIDQLDAGTLQAVTQSGQISSAFVLRDNANAVVASGTVDGTNGRAQVDFLVDQPPLPLNATVGFRIEADVRLVATTPTSGQVLSGKEQVLRIPAGGILDAAGLPVGNTEDVSAPRVAYRGLPVCATAALIATVVPGDSSRQTISMTCSSDPDGEQVQLDAVGMGFTATANIGAAFTLTSMEVVDATSLVIPGIPGSCGAACFNKTFGNAITLPLGSSVEIRCNFDFTGADAANGGDEMDIFPVPAEFVVEDSAGPHDSVGTLLTGVTVGVQ